MRAFGLAALLLSTGFHGSVLAQTARQGSDARLSLRLEVAQPSFKRQDLVVFRLLIENGRPGCSTSLFDRVISGDPSPRRPLSLLEFDIFDEGGKSVPRGPHSEANWAIMDSRTLMRLDCWESFGKLVMPASAEWGYRLPAGLYRVRARLALKARDFFAKRLPLVRESADWIGMKPDNFLDALEDEMLVSDEVRFEIRP